MEYVTAVVPVTWLPEACAPPGPSLSQKMQLAMLGDPPETRSPAATLTVEKFPTMVQLRSWVLPPLPIHRAPPPPPPVAVFLWKTQLVTRTPLVE